MEGLELKIGMPIKLVSVKGLSKYPLWKGQQGMANSLVNVEGVDYVYFMPDNTTRIYVIREDKVVIDDERIESWLEANT